MLTGLSLSNTLMALIVLHSPIFLLTILFVCPVCCRTNTTGIYYLLSDFCLNLADYACLSFCHVMLQHSLKEHGLRCSVCIVLEVNVWSRLVFNRET